MEGVEGGRRLDRWRFEEAVGAGKSKWLLGRTVRTGGANFQAYTA